MFWRRSLRDSFLLEQLSRSVSLSSSRTDGRARHRQHLGKPPGTQFPYVRERSQRTSSLRGEGGGFEKRTGVYFPILFVKDFGNLKDEGGWKSHFFRGRPLWTLPYCCPLQYRVGSTGISWLKHWGRFQTASSTITDTINGNFYQFMT